MNKLKLIVIILLIGLVAYLSLVTYLCYTTKMADLINDSINSNTYFVSSNMAEFFLFNFRGTDKDIKELKTEDGGLNYIVSAITLSKVSKEKREKYLKYFISKGCDINAVSNIDGVSPLHTAAIVADADMVKLLLENGADPFLKSTPTGILRTSMTPLEMAEKSQKKAVGKDYSEVIEVLRKAEKIKRGSGSSKASHPPQSYA